MHLEIPAFGQQKTPIKSGFLRNISFLCSYYGAPWGIRTLDLLLRRQLLYPTELRVQNILIHVKIKAA